MLSQSQLIDSLVKYFLEGLAVAFVAFYIPKTKTNLNDILLIALTASTTFLILDLFAPSVSFGARIGTGFNISKGIIKEPFEEKCPKNSRDVGLLYIKKYGANVLQRTDLTNLQKKKLIFQNMKTHMDNLNPPLEKKDFNNHLLISKRLGLC